MRESRGWAVVLSAYLVVVSLLQLGVQVWLNLWNRNFFDSLERRDVGALQTLAELFVPLAAASILLGAASVWGRMTAQRKWRRAMTRHVVAKWLAKHRYRQLGHLVKGTENPEYRIAVDIRVATDIPVDLALAFLSSVMTALAFFGVLWSVGGSLELPVLGMTVTIPGYLVVGVIIYSGIMTSLMLFFGHHLTGVIEHLNQSEAEFRAAVDAFRLEPNGDESHPGNGKAATLTVKLQNALVSWRELCWQLVRTTLVGQGNPILAPVVGWLLCLPKYLTGAMTLGELTQSAAAFVTVQGAFNWLVDNYQRVADWQSSAHRVATLLVALDELEANEAAGQMSSRPDSQVISS
ncbi:MAG: SbmA/BacA-like family transporter [Xanthobacteraceae bacterium]|nr:SbmA/BacA-like family transporter [Xanthobacteraceae bacterium]